MRLNDLRRLAVKKQLRVRFTLANGMHCIVNEHGVGTVPGLNGTPELNLEEELERATEFNLESAAAGRNAHGNSTVVGRERLQQMVGAEAGSPAAVPEHEG